MPSARKTLSGYLIDPAVATIRAVEFDSAHFFRALCWLIGCRRLEQVDLDESHIAYCDSLGVTEPVTGLWTFPDRGSQPPIAGRGVIVGNNGAGAPTLPLRSFAAMITVYRPVIVPDAAALAQLAELHTTNLGTAFRQQVRFNGFQLEIETRNPLSIDDNLDRIRLSRFVNTVKISGDLLVKWQGE